MGPSTRYLKRDSGGELETSSLPDINFTEHLALLVCRFMSVAVVLVLPGLRPSASPAVLIVATLVLEDFHVTTVVRSAVDPFAKLAVAVKLLRAAHADRRRHR